MHEIWYRIYDLRQPNRLQEIIIVLLGLTGTAIVAELNHRLLEAPLREHGKRRAAAYRARFQLAPAE